jgi:hypothetical protein
MCCILLNYYQNMAYAGGGVMADSSTSPMRLDSTLVAAAERKGSIQTLARLFARDDRSIK